MLKYTTESQAQSSQETTTKLQLEPRESQGPFLPQAHSAALVPNPRKLPRCRTCAHWDLGRKEEKWYDQNDTCAEREFLPCKRIPHERQATEDKEKEGSEWGETEKVLVPDHKDTLALAADPSLYRAWLEVSADFGCVHHEERAE